MTSYPPQEKPKRRGTTLSCAECRRLKLRCSRVFPCPSCVKKGCAAICPDGSLTTMKGNRFVLANTEELHEKISVLSARVRQLEDALNEAHARFSSENHPLLSPDLLQIKRPLEREAPEAPKEPDIDTAEAIDAVGSLSINEAGHSKFFGPLANAWYLLQNEEGSDDETSEEQINLPSDIPFLSHMFPFAPNVRETRAIVRQSLLSTLPDLAQAQQLANIYFQHYAWMHMPIPESEFLTTILHPIYETGIALDQDPIDSHRLAVLFMIFALGTLLDLEKPYLSVEASRYYQLARAALSLDSILEHQSIPAIQALLLICHYMFLAFVDGPRWALMGLVVKLAQSLGLHRDSGKWNLNPEEAYRRRSLLWEAYSYDSWQSLTFGRPPSFSNAFIDTQMADPEPVLDKDGEHEMSYAAWKHRYASRCLNWVQEQAFGARPPSYKLVQELDKKVRGFYIPPSLRVPGFGSTATKTVEVEPPSLQLTMQRHVVFSLKEITLFYIHRGFFARAIEDSPNDPLRSKYAQSVLAAYNSACTYVGLVKTLHSQYPRLTERFWFFFTHVFSCAVVLGTIPTKCPSIAFAQSALTHLQNAYNLFDMVKENDRAARVLPVLQKLKDRAFLAMANHTNGITSNSPLSPLLPSTEEEEIAALRGKTRLVSVTRKSPSTPSSPQDFRQQHTPSPLNVPAHRFTPEPVYISERSQASSSQWSAFATQADGQYPAYYQDGTQWHAEYGPQMQSQSASVFSSHPSYTGFETFSPISNDYMPHPSPMETPINTMDPTEAWRSLMAQYQG